MNDFPLISPKDKRLSLFLSLGLGITLSLVLLPGIHSLNQELQKLFPSYPVMNSKAFEMSLFTFVSALIFLSVPTQARAAEKSERTLASLLSSFPLPILVSFLFGCLMRSFFSVSSHRWIHDVFWFVVCIPMGEELLFRGWSWSIFKSLGKKSFFSLTNPLPSELVFSSLTFSLWHLQNHKQVSLGFLLFQLLYTFLTGLWLGYLRWKTGQIHSSILAHGAINLAAIIPVLV